MSETDLKLHAYCVFFLIKWWVLIKLFMLVMPLEIILKPSF